MVSKFYKLIFLITLSIIINNNLSTNDIFAEADTTQQPISLDSSQNPWRGIGVLEDTANNKTCTAIVVGDSEIMTSAYCLLDNDGNKIQNLTQLSFKSGFQDGFFLTKTQIVSFLMPKLTYPPKNMVDLKNSWAFLFTSTPIGQQVGIIKINTNPIDSEYLKNHRLITVGYQDNIKNGLLASIKCSLNIDGIKYNDKTPNDPAPLFLQNCIDYFKPLIGSPVVAVDNDNNVSLVAIVSAKLSKNIPDKKNKPKKLDLNVLVPMTYLNIPQQTAEAQQSLNDNDNASSTPNNLDNSNNSQ
ncbi:hypothetical protein ACFX5K_02445 [Rickettsiales bacterium LUAb2]